MIRGIMRIIRNSALEWMHGLRVVRLVSSLAHYEPAWREVLLDQVPRLLASCGRPHPRVDDFAATLGAGGWQASDPREWQAGVFDG